MAAKNAQFRASETPENEYIELVLRAKQGDQGSFSDLYDLYFEKIYRFIFFRVNHKETAEDLAEDVFIKAWVKIKSVNEESFSGWLYSIAKNRVIDHYRQSKQVSDLTELENILESEDNLVEQVGLAVNQQIFLKLLKQLTPEQQIVIKLKFMEGMENEEISDLISKTEGSIRVTQHRAIQKLQELLEEYKEANKINEND